MPKKKLILKPKKKKKLILTPKKKPRTMEERLRELNKIPRNRIT